MAGFQESVAADWSRGIVRDAPRTAIPQSGLYDCVNGMVDQPGLIYKRGGTSYAGPAMTSATYAAALAYANFTSGAKLVGVGDNGHLYTITAGTTTDVSTLGSAFGGIVDRPKMRFGNKLLIPNDGTVAAKYYDGTTVSAFPASAPYFKYVDVYKTFVSVAGVSAQPQRVYFGPTPDFTTAWNTSYSYWDFDNEITGLAALSNALLVFTGDAHYRLVGSIAPPGSDFNAGIAGNVGCTDARSIAVTGGNCIFANTMGVYATNGVSPLDLTESGGISTYWQSLFSGYSRSSWTISGGTFGNYYVVTIMNGSTFVDCLLCDLTKRAWVRLSNIKATMFATNTGASSEMYYSDRSTNRLVTLGSSLAPGVTTKNDADGTAVALTAELRIIGDGPALKRFGHGRITYDMADSASDNPTLAVSFAENVTAPSFTACPESPLAETSDVTRKRFTVNREAQGLTVKLVQANASSKTNIYAVEVETRQLPFMGEGA
jgi:hypothetical protein